MYEWDFGDGTPGMTGPQNSVTHTYQQTGVYKLQTTAANPIGSESTSVDVFIGGIVIRVQKNYFHQLTNPL